MESKIHKTTYVGSYSDGNNTTRPYRVTLDVPEEVVKNVNAIGWFKAQMRDTKSDAHKLFIKDYPDFAVLTTHQMEDITPCLTK